MCIENFCEQHEYTIQGLIALGTFGAIIISLWLARRHPFKLKGKLSLNGTSPTHSPFSLKCIVKKGGELLSHSDARTYGNPHNIEFRGLHGLLMQQVFQSKNISKILGKENDSPRILVMAGFGYPLLDSCPMPLTFIDYPENFHLKDKVALLKTLYSEEKKMWRILIFLRDLFYWNWKLHLHHMQLGVIKIKPTKEAKKIITQLLLNPLSEKSKDNSSAVTKK